MYAIRLEPGRELEDLLFRRMQAKRDAEERAAERYRIKRARFLRKIISAALHFGFLLGILIFVVADIVKFNEYSDLAERLEKRPEFLPAHPIIDVTVVEEARIKAEEEEKLKNTQYFAEMTDKTEGFGEDVISQYGVVIDMNNDTILAAKEGKTRVSPASMTKILTVLVAAENIAEDNLDDTFTITPEINYYASSHGASRVGFNDNETVTVRDLFYGTILPSGADAAVGLATYIAGSHEAFVDMMNEKLATLGLSDTAHFTNCVGLYDDNHYCTCYDMAMIMRAAVANPLCRDVMSTRIYTTSATTQHPNGIEISNWFLRRAEDKPIGATLNCAKTGYVKQSGNCAASYASDDNGRQLIVVTVMSNGSWRCIYDHIALYRKYFADYDPNKADPEREALEAEGQIQDH